MFDGVPNLKISFPSFEDIRNFKDRL